MATCNRILCAVLITLSFATAARAASVPIGWDANPESDIAGYLVSYGRSSGAEEALVDVGLATTWTLPNAQAGSTYFFRVYAYNDSGMQSAASSEVSTTVGAGSDALISVNRSRLNFGATRSGSSTTSMTPAQTVVVAQSGGTAVAWTVAVNAPWMRVTPASGAGAGVFTVQLVAGTMPAAGIQDASIILTSSGGVQTVPVRLRVYDAGTSGVPVGAFDTPIDGTTNVTGAIPVTGWALDDVSVTKVQVFRDPVLSGETGAIYIGDATFVAGARPDVENGYSEWPASDRGGWGFMVLTNMLPDVPMGTSTGGNGTFRLRAYALDAEGHTTDLGYKTITAANRGADKPFGTLDTPTQGGTASGSAFVNFGWAIAPGGTIPEDGSTLTVLVDGVALGHPTYNNFRSDIAAAFPDQANSNGAIGYFVIDTTKLTNGVHTISWVASDSLGNTSGLGSRFFNVMNGSSAAATQARRRGVSAASTARTSQSSGVNAQAIADLPVENAMVEVARLAETDRSPELVVPEWTGELRIRTREADPIDLKLASQSGDTAGGTYEGFMVFGGNLRPLPPGSTLDAQKGTFTWQPGAGFVGTYQLVFLHTLPGGAKTKIPVRVRIVPKFDRDGRSADRR